MACADTGRRVTTHMDNPPTKPPRWRVSPKPAVKSSAPERPIENLKTMAQKFGGSEGVLYVLANLSVAFI